MVAAAVLAAIGYTAEAWRELSPEQKRNIKTKIENGQKGLAKIMANRFKQLPKILPKKKAPKKRKKKTVKRR